MGTKAALFWALSDWRPRAPYDGGALRRMAPYSTRLLTTDLIASVYNNISQLFVGRMYSADTLAYFNQAQKLKELPVTGTVQSVQNVTFPALAKIAEDGPKFAESYRQMVLVVTFVMFPAMAGLNAVAHDFFAVFLGTKWMPIVPYFRIACLGGLFAPVAMISYNVLKVKSNGSVIVRLEVAKKLVMTGILALTIPRGPIAITWGLAVAALCDAAVHAFHDRMFPPHAVAGRSRLGPDVRSDPAAGAVDRFPAGARAAHQDGAWRRHLRRRSGGVALRGFRGGCGANEKVHPQGMNFFSACVPMWGRCES